MADLFRSARSESSNAASVIVTVNTPSPRRKGLPILDFWPLLAGEQIGACRVTYLEREPSSLSGRTVSDITRTKRRDRTVACPRCGTTMDEVASIAPSFGEPGLIGYECPNCVYVTSELVRPTDEYERSGRAGGR